ncbi:receptor-like protein 43 [Ipomoea triloba]|uniref:receptor-like protein 43 n=1 Tax=Ipomoea triloba TaxID=35885 RepID=UPI00125E6A2C|nr:receptor-like protein 43 [Ipomoea triloba]
MMQLRWNWDYTSKPRSRKLTAPTPSGVTLRLPYPQSAGALCRTHGLPLLPGLVLPDQGRECGQVRLMEIRYLATSPFSLFAIYPGLGGASVSEINLPNADLCGTLHHLNFTSFPSLTRFSVSGNKFNGSIPPTIGDLSNLVFLDLSNNRFDGSIPPQIGKLRELQYLSLYHNNISGVVPYQIGNLQKVWFLDLGSNSYLEAPDNWSRVKSFPVLRHLSFAGNKFGPRFPDFILDCRNITHLDLSRNYLNGSIPESLFTTLEKLEYLYLIDNNFSGPLSSNIGKLSNLKVLDLWSNYFKGEIPSSIGQLQNLQVLYISNNEFNSSIPFELGRCTNLTGLDLSFNSLFGALPSSLSSLTKLSKLNLSNNFLSGNISPNFFSNWTELTSLHLQNNSFNGSIPSEIGLLTNLVCLFLDSNQFSGNIPTHIGNLQNLYFLDMSKNNLYGSIPPTIANLTSLSSLLLSTNNLTGTLLSENEDLISSIICNIHSLKILALANNSLSGPIPQCLGNISLYVLDLHKNQFHGPIPTLGNSLKSLNLRENQLERTLPRSLINCKELEVLDLGHNNLNGTLPMWLGVLPNLKVLSLRFNKLNGFIESTGIKGYMFPQLRVFDISYNEFIGDLPTMLFKIFKAMANEDEDRIPKGEMYLKQNYYYQDSLVIGMKGQERDIVKILITFTTIDLSCNKFEGHIPNSIGDLLALRELNLSHNMFTGLIPASLGNLSVLESLDLSSNQIGGAIPGQLTSISSLEVLNLSHNKLVGCIPQGKQFNTFEANSYKGNDGLKGKPLSSRGCENDITPQLPASKKLHQEDDSSFLSGCTVKVVAMGYGCGILFGLFVGSLMLLTGKLEFITRFIEEEGYKLVMKLKQRR